MEPIDTKEIKLTLKCLSVYNGDAILLSYTDNDGFRKNILVDGGFVKTYIQILKPELTRIHKQEEKLNLVIATHYDNDHIGGLIKLINDKDFNSEFVKQWWLNCDLPLISPTGEIGAEQVLTLKKSLQYQGKLPTAPITTGTSPLNLGGGLLTVLSPDEIRYNLAKCAIERKMTEISVTPSDYSFPIEHFKSAVEEESKEDDSVANGASIAVLFSLSDQNILLTGDGFPSVISHSLRNLGFDSSNPLTLKCIKLSHHASKANISNELLSLIKTQKFIVSANAINPHNLPHKETIVRILLNGKRDSSDYFDFYFTHKNEPLETMFKIDGPDVFKEYRFRFHFPNLGENGIQI